MIGIDIIIYIAIFCIGTVFGSFFTLAVYRIPLGKDITHERSFCPICNHKLSFFDMIPVLSYIFLGGKCRYCKEKIRPRYFLLEILSGIVFVLFALSLRISILNLNINTLIYFVFGLLYFATLFIIAGIDKEKTEIQKSVLLFGFVVETLYILYIYLTQNNAGVYRYIIYLSITCLLVILDILIFRRKLKNSYPVEVLLLCMFLLMFSYEDITVLSIILTVLTIAIKLLLSKIFSKKTKSVVVDKKEIKLPIGFYLCISNIICIIINNFCMYSFIKFY